MPAECVSDKETPIISQFFGSNLGSSDLDVSIALNKELRRQQRQVELIASENIVSRAVLEATGSIFTNKYAEGYPGRRYYGGCEHVDVVEQLAIDRAKELFNCDFVNVQPHSGAQANTAVLFALLKPHDTVMGMSLAAGGHLTHGAGPSLSGRWFESIQYGVRQENALIDMEEVSRLAHLHKPKLIICGGSAYPRMINFEAFRMISDDVGAMLMVDMAHIAGLVATGVHPSPFPHAHVVTTTTHKTLRGPRGGMILGMDEEINRKINSAIFPGIQGGPLIHVIAGKAVALGEALKPDFKDYIDRVVENAKALANRLAIGGFEIVSGGTDTHLLLVDLRAKNLTGDIAEDCLERSGITCNKNGIPFDPEKPTVTSGIRLGSPAATSRGFGVSEFNQIGELIIESLDGLATAGTRNQGVELSVRNRVQELCERFPIYPAMA